MESVNESTVLSRSAGICAFPGTQQQAGQRRAARQAPAATLQCLVDRQPVLPFHAFYVARSNTRKPSSAPVVGIGPFQDLSDRQPLLLTAWRPAASVFRQQAGQRGTIWQSPAAALQCEIDRRPTLVRRSHAPDRNVSLAIGRCADGGRRPIPGFARSNAVSCSGGDDPGVPPTDGPAMIRLVGRDCRTQSGVDRRHFSRSYAFDTTGVGSHKPAGAPIMGVGPRRICSIEAAVSGLRADGPGFRQQAASVHPAGSPRLPCLKATGSPTSSHPQRLPRHRN